MSTRIRMPARKPSDFLSERLGVLGVRLDHAEAAGDAALAVYLRDQIEKFKKEFDAARLAEARPKPEHRQSRASDVLGAAQARLFGKRTK